jgi:hypothetical protein
MALGGTLRNVWAYRLAGSSYYDEGFSGSYAGYLFQAYVGTSNENATFAERGLGTNGTAGYLFAGFGAGSFVSTNNTFSFIGGTCAGGTNAGTFQTFAILGYYNVSGFANVVYSTSISMYTPSGGATAFLKWDVTVGKGGVFNDGFVNALAMEITLSRRERWIPAEDPSLFVQQGVWSMSHAVMVDEFDTTATIHGTSSVISISANAFMATMVVRGTNLSGKTINPGRIDLYCTGGGYATVIGTIFRFGTGVCGSLTKYFHSGQVYRDAPKPGTLVNAFSAWKSLAPNDIWQATFFFGI